MAVVLKSIALATFNYIVLYTIYIYNILNDDHKYTMIAVRSQVNSQIMVSTVLWKHSDTMILSIKNGQYLFVCAQGHTPGDKTPSG